MKLKDKHIFLVEDDPVNFAVIRTLLRKHGAVVPLENWAGHYSNTDFELPL